MTTSGHGACCHQHVLIVVAVWREVRLCTAAAAVKWGPWVLRAQHTPRWQLLVTCTLAGRALGPVGLAPERGRLRAICVCSRGRRTDALLPL